LIVHETHDIIAGGESNDIMWIVTLPVAVSNISTSLIYLLAHLTEGGVRGTVREHHIWAAPRAHPVGGPMASDNQTG